MSGTAARVAPRRELATNPNGISMPSGPSRQSFGASIAVGFRYIPEELHSLPRTITSKKKTLYDQIAWFDGKENVPALDLEYSSCGYFDFTKTALRSRKLSREKLSHVISDHYSLWVEFTLRP